MWPMDWMRVAAASPKHRATWRTWWGPVVQRRAAPMPKNTKNMVPKNSAKTARQKFMDRNSHMVTFRLRLPTRWRRFFKKKSEFGKGVPFQSSSNAKNNKKMFSLLKSAKSADQKKKRSVLIQRQKQDLRTSTDESTRQIFTTWTGLVKSTQLRSLATSVHLSQRHRCEIMWECGWRSQVGELSRGGGHQC